MKVFLSYRWNDSRDATARVAAHLSHTRGITHVFLDVAAIEAGAQFVEKIRTMLARSDVVLVMMGHNWLDGPRLNDPNDLVRQELMLALNSGKRVIPVLLHGAQMPRAEALPEEIRGIVYLNASYVRHESFEPDMVALVDALFGRKPAGSQLERLLRRFPVLATALRSVWGVGVGGLALLVFAILHQLTTGQSLDQTFGPRLVWPVILAFPLVGGAVPWFVRGR